MSTDTLRPPLLPLMFAEAPRAMAEYGLLGVGLPLLAKAPRGDGHPVMVLPGMAASDFSTQPLRRFLRAKGYAAVGWRQGRNMGKEELIEPLLARLGELHRRHGRKVSLVGWSLGGIYAREIAKLAPEQVRSVITLATPFRGSYRASNAWRLYEWLSGKKANDDNQARFAARPPVPTTAIYTRTDGIVAWQRCVETPAPGDEVENVEVPGSHSGLGHNALAMYVVADRLAQPEGQWQPFKPGGLAGKLYPKPRR